MARIVARVVIVLLLVSAGTFLLVSLLPGDPAQAILGPDQPASRYEEVNRELNLDDPIVIRYVRWLGDVLTGDLGRSFLPPRGQVTERVGAALPISAQLAFMSVGIALLVSVPLALLSAWRAGTRADRAIGSASFAVLSTPSFLLGLVLIIVFVQQLGMLPRARWVRLTDGGLMENLRHAVLPVATIALPQIAIYTRVLRSDLISTLQEDFVVAARARGLSTVQLLFGEVLKPSSLPLVTLVGISLGNVIASTVIVEVIFSLPGLGTLIVESSANGDIPVVQGAVLLIGTLYVLINAGADALYGVLDPRSRRG